MSVWPRPSAAALGVLMLDTRFARIQGDIGHAATWPFPVHYHCVRGAEVAQVVNGNQTLDGLVAAADELILRGARGITTSCGFLIGAQATLASALSVPVWTSALLQYRLIRSLLPANRHVGILTFSRQHLSPAHLQAAGIPLHTPVLGLDDIDSHLRRVILGQVPALDVCRAEREMQQLALQLQKSTPKLGAILLECTNMAPYAASIRRATGLPVFDVVTGGCWFQASLAP